MKNRIMGAVEVNTVKCNLENIEKTLGRSIPAGLIGADDLKDHILSPMEVYTVCNNIERITQNRTYKGFDLVNLVENICMWSFFIIIILYICGVDVLGWIQTLID